MALEALEVADSPRAWAESGFTVGDDGTCVVGQVAIRLVGREHGTGLVGWDLSGVVPEALEDGGIDGIPTGIVPAGTGLPGTVHPNGVTSIDHVVVLAADLARTVNALGAVGLDPRRERDGELGGAAIRQVFFRIGSTILEVVGSPDTAGPGPATLWGVTYVVEDIDAAAAYFGERTSRVKDAVQPGRRITTLRHRELDLSVRTALITPHVR